MNQIPSKHIDGDVVVNRNVTSGGDANVRGNATIDHDLKVKGWLDAVNIKAANKGVFISEDDLNETYPEPENGWWAVVGTELPGDIYVGAGGVWKPTGGKGGNPTVDGGALVSEAIEIAKEAKEMADSSKQLSEDTVNSIGKPDGLCPLDETGHVASRYLPSYVDDIVEFTEMLTGLVDPLFCEELPEEYASLPNEGTGNDIVLKWVAEASAVNVFYLPDEQRFICGRRAKIMRGNTVIKDIILTAPNKFFAEFGFEVVGGLAIPLINTIYVDLSDCKWYRWSGNALVEMPKNVELGEQAGMAYPGNLGAENRERVDQLQQQIDSLSSSESSEVGFPRIFCESNGYELRLYGARPYLEAGYIPFLLRPTSKRNRFVVSESGGESIYHSDVKRGWHQMYDTDYINIDPEDGLVTFKHKRLKTSNIPHIKVHIKKRRALTGDRYDMPVISWGKNCIDLARRLSLISDNYMDNDVKWRTIRLPFAIVFAKPDFDRDIQPVTQNHIVSNLAYFSLIYAGEKPSGSLARPIFNPKLGT